MVQGTYHEVSLDVLPASYWPDIPYPLRRTCFVVPHLRIWTGGAGQGGRPRSDDWFTINKDYSGSRYVDRDEITPANVGLSQR
jgi:hypothetical protein